MDIFIPGIEKSWRFTKRERFDVLVEKMKALGIDEEELWWFRYTKIWFSCSLWFWTRFERLVYCCQNDNIRDVIPFQEHH
jgi:asparaginyl-tRNA synthetase